MNGFIFHLLICCLALLVIPIAASAQDKQAEAGQPHRSGDMRQTSGPGPRQPVPVIPRNGTVDVILGCPTDSSIILSILRYDRDGGASITYTPQAGRTSVRSAELRLRKGRSQEITLERLQSNTRYAYEVRDAQSGKPLVKGRFQTQRPSGSSFSFTITADSHLDLNTDPALYQRTLANAETDTPDFHIDLGDTFMTGKHESRNSAIQQYLAQRAYFGQVGHSIPLYLVLGNHDGEESRLSRDGIDNLAAWANSMRKRYFPNPAPDAFYTGNGKTDQWAGQLQDYYAWRWGDALFVVLDPYWHGNSRRGDERWDLSLGDIQYQWLQQTLEGSKARHKFVFVHQLIGGHDRQGRGGVEAAGFGEWGGLNADGSDGFTVHRPGWDMPIHKLLVRHGVSAVFHGHDHLYAMQRLDGIVYQEVPQPGHPGQGIPRSAVEYGYREGVILGGSGHLRIGVSPEKVRVDFIQAGVSNGSGNGQVAHSYTILAAE